MIKNIVFDVGKVLVKWSPDSLSKMIFNDAHEAEVCANKVFCSPIWPQFDLGEEDEETTKNKIKANLPKEDHFIVDKAISTYAHIVGFDEKTNEWARKMKKKGYKIYLLTNFAVQFIHTFERMPIRDIVDGYICSSDVKVMKPDLNIYRILLEKYNLKGEECLFIDDVKANTDAALQVGFGKVITFKGSVEELEEFDK